ncbi:MAG TPA: signal peptidase I [Alphaproteobacteria bacterium]|jgi:signal peptidase I
MKKTQSGGLGETIRTIIYAGLIALTIRTVAYEPFNIPSASMVPTLLIGDYLFVSKYSYGYSHFSLPLAPNLFSGRIFFNPPKRGDVAVFKLPRDNKTDYIKRIIGLPGDRIQVTGGILQINGEPVKRERVGNYVEYDAAGNSAYRTLFNETLPEGRVHPILEITDSGTFDNTGVYVVPEGQYFMMGDNRDNSMDSRARFEVGYVPAENLVGRAEFLFFSSDGSASLLEFWKWPSAIRFSRIFTRIR